MGIVAAAFCDLVTTALSYSAVKFGLVSANFAIINTIVVWFFSGPFVYFGAYRAALAKIALSPRQ